jgi:2'-5' RNA ligase
MAAKNATNADTSSNYRAVTALTGKLTEDEVLELTLELTGDFTHDAAEELIRAIAKAHGLPAYV